MPTRTIKVTGVPDELLRLVDARVKSQHLVGRSEYVRDLMRRDLLGSGGGTSFREILGPIHRETEALGIKDSDILEMVETERNAMRARRSKQVSR